MQSDVSKFFKDRLVTKLFNETVKYCPIVQNIGLNLDAQQMCSNNILTQSKQEFEHCRCGYCNNKSQVRKYLALV